MKHLLKLEVQFLGGAARKGSLRGVPKCRKTAKHNIQKELYELAWRKKVRVRTIAVDDEVLSTKRLLKPARTK